LFLITAPLLYAAANIPKVLALCPPAQAAGVDKAMMRRIHLVPFEYVVPEDKKDKDLSKSSRRKHVEF